MEETQNERTQEDYEAKYIRISVKQEEVKLNQDKKQSICEGIDESREETKEIIQPYMSEEIHSVLKEMGAYLLEKESDEIAATIQIEQIEQIEQIATSKQPEATINDFRRKLVENLQGRKLTQHIICQSGEYIGRQGDVVTLPMLQIARENDCMIKVIRYSQ